MNDVVVHTTIFSMGIFYDDVVVHTAIFSIGISYERSKFFVYIVLVGNGMPIPALCKPL